MLSAICWYFILLTSLFPLRCLSFSWTSIHSHIFSFLYFPGMFSICCTSLWCRKPTDPSKKPPRTLFWLLLWVPPQLLLSHPPSDRRQAPPGVLPDEQDPLLPPPAAAGRGFLLPKSAAELGPEPQPGLGAGGGRGLCPAVPGWGCPWPEEPGAVGPRRCPDRLHLHSPAAGPRLAPPIRWQPAGGAIPGYSEHSAGYPVAGGPEGLPGDGFPPRAQGQRETLCLLLIHG